MRITILGAGGFIGSHMVEHLLARAEHEVVGVDVTPEKLEGIGDRRGWRFYQSDVRWSPAVLEEVVRSADLVVDLIAHANPSMYVTSPIEVFDLNFLQNLNIAKLCIAHRKRLIQYSSAEVYGKNTSGQRYSEDGSDFTYGPVQKQRWIYAAGKALLERVLYAYGVDGDLEYTIVRPFNFLGSRIDYLVPANAIGGPRVFPHFMSALLERGPMRLVDGGYVHRAFLHIADANEAFQTLLDRREETRNQIYNVGNPDNNVTIREFALLMCELYVQLTGRACPSSLIDISGEQFYGSGYEDGDRLPPDISRMRALGWLPRRDLYTTVRDTMCYYLRRARLIGPVADGTVASASRSCAG